MYLNSCEKEEKKKICHMHHVCPRPIFFWGLIYAFETQLLWFRFRAHKILYFIFVMI